MSELKRKVQITPQGNQIEIRWFLIGEKGAVDFHIHSRSDSPYNSGNIYAGGCELHSPIPLHEGQKPIKGCKIINGDCYADGTSLYAIETVFPEFMAGGEDAIWYRLEYLYKSWFEEQQDGAEG